ncbi:MAG: helix-turn-helix domain-containing protein [Bacteroidetes bacterium]|uniref:Helix-turn-helix domain-containing protein n=1 Tax=Candidatus Caccoplasma merdipullorum TaxID=2840718 RepID=A0A9D9E472_9BACT|nr:helix-turn-helix domain-containing protein [Candidatus Caccoplasma merdipullorum]
MEETLYIKNMVCGRCVAAVEKALAEQGIVPVSVELGVVRLSEPLNPDYRERLRGELERLGFSLLEEYNAQLVAHVKGAVIEYARGVPAAHRDNLSEFLSHRINRDYSFISKLFSETCGITVEKFLIAQRVEYVKELLSYGELSLGEIADRLGYSSAAYLSSQFKRVTGMTPGEFRNLPVKERRPLDSF